MRKIMLILNAAADRGRSGQQASDLRPIVEKRGGAHWEATEYPAHASDLAEQAGKEGYDTVVSLGGDGTAHEVINGLMRLPKAQRPKLGIVPIGSGNDFAFGCGIDFNPQAAMERVFSGEARPIDIGSIADGNGRQEYWMNAAGMLIVAAVNIQSRRIKRLYGFAMYTLAAIRAILQNYDATRIRMTVDGVATEHSLILLTIGNGPREGGGFYTNPPAKNDDGIFNYMQATPISRLMMFRLLPEIMNGRQEKYDFVTFGQFKTLKLEADRALPIHLDGEMWAYYEADVRTVTLQVHPSALNVIR